MTPDLRPALAALMLCAALMPAFTNAANVQATVSQLPPGLVPNPIPPPASLIPSGVLPVAVVGMSITVKGEAPPAVMTGSSFKAMFEARLNSIGATIIQLTPVDVDSDNCGVSSVELMSGVDLGDNQYLLYNVPGTFSPQQEELQMHTLAPFVRLSVGYKTDQNILQGHCLARAVVVQPLEVPQTLPFHVTENVTVQAPGVPVDMGALHSMSSWDAQDYAFVEKLPVPSNVTFVCLPAACTIALTGLVSHTDGADWGDYGRFWYSGGNVSTDNGMSVADGTTTAQMYQLATEPDHAPGKIKVTRYCFIGYLVDGGSTDTWEEPHAEACVNVSTWEPDVDPDLTVDVCDLYHSAEAEVQYAAGSPVAFLNPVTGTFSGTWVGINRDHWDPLCGDRQLPPVPPVPPLPGSGILEEVLPDDPINPDELPEVPELPDPMELCGDLCER
jgi:hypothetical protein